MSPFDIFVLFLSFGVRVFGGPMAQVNSMREQLVDEWKWVTPARFSRVYAVYQALPGPIATELACYFGTLACGPLGGVLAGLGFILPGFGLMVACAWFYEAYGIKNAAFLATFAGLQPAITAMLFRAAHKVGDAVCRHHESGAWNWKLLAVVALSTLESALGLNFFIIKVHMVMFYMLAHHARVWLAAAVAVAGITAVVTAVALKGPMQSLVPQGMGIAHALGNSPLAEFLVGLVGGLVTFGGAYTAIPFVLYETVTSGGWVSAQFILGSIAVCSLLPAPMVMFATMVGYGANRFIGASVMTIGMFLPAFVLPITLHKHLQQVLVDETGTIAQVIDGLAAMSVGLIIVTALQLLRNNVTHTYDPIIFLVSLHVMYSVTHPFTSVRIISAAAVAGYILYN